MTATWVRHDVRDQAVDFRPALVGKDRDWLRAIHRLAGRHRQQFYDWRQRYRQVNEHNGWVPRDFWLEPWE